MLNEIISASVHTPCGCVIVQDRLEGRGKIFRVNLTFFLRSSSVFYDDGSHQPRDGLWESLFFSFPFRDDFKGGYTGINSTRDFRAYLGLHFVRDVWISGGTLLNVLAGNPT